MDELIYLSSFIIQTVDGRICWKIQEQLLSCKKRFRIRKLCEKWGLEILYGESGIRAGKFGFIISDGYRQKGRSIHKFKKTLSELLEEEEICIVRTVAYERDSMNELHARTIAIDSQGRELTVDLDDLYAMVRKEWGLEAGTPEEL